MNKIPAICGPEFVFHIVKTTMANNDKNDKEKKKEQPPVSKFLKPDKETLHTTDPQEHMKGPLSSIVQSGKEEAEENDEESKEQADKKKDKNT